MDDNVQPCEAKKQPPLLMAKENVMPVKKDLTLTSTVGTGTKSTTNWEPIHFTGDFEDDEGIKHALLMALLPSGVDSHELSFHLVNGNKDLSMTVRVPEVMTKGKLEQIFKYYKANAKQTQCKFDDKNIVRQHALIKAVREGRDSGSEPVFRTCVIPLGMEVEPNIASSSYDFLESAQGARIILMDLKTPSKKYTSPPELKGFVMLEDSSKEEDDVLA